MAVVSDIDLAVSKRKPNKWLQLNESFLLSQKEVPKQAI